MRRAILVAVGLLCMSQGTAWGYASYTDGYELQRVCSNDSDAARQACFYYIKSGFDMISSIGRHVERICVPEGTRAVQLEDAVKEWLHDNPDKWQWTAAFIVEKALTVKFPCN